MQKQQFTGKTLEEAVKAAALAFGCSVENVKYENQSQASGGLFNKLFARAVKIDAWTESTSASKTSTTLRSPQSDNDAREAARQAVLEAMGKVETPKQKSSQPKHSDPKNAATKREPKEQIETRERKFNKEPRPATETRPPRENFEPRVDRPLVDLNSPGVKELLIAFSQDFSAAFGGSKKPEIKVEGDIATVVLENKEIETILEKSDKLSGAFEHLFKRVAQKHLGDVSTRIVLEAGSAAEARRSHLEQMALSLAEKVKESGKTSSLFAKSSQERRIIHLALENMEGIATKSIGIGDKRKLIIFSTLHERAPRPPRAQNIQKQNSMQKPHNNRKLQNNQTQNEPKQSVDTTEKSAEALRENQKQQTQRPQNPRPQNQRTQNPRPQQRGPRSPGSLREPRSPRQPNGSLGGVRREGTDFGDMPSRTEKLSTEKS